MVWLSLCLCVCVPVCVAGLEAEDAGCDVVHVRPPPGHDGVAGDGRAGDAGGGQRPLEPLPRLGVRQLRSSTSTLPSAHADERVALLALTVTARHPLGAAAPEVVATAGHRTGGPLEAQRTQGGRRVELHPAQHSQGRSEGEWVCMCRVPGVRRCSA